MVGGISRESRVEREDERSRKSMAMQARTAGVLKTRQEKSACENPWFILKCKRKQKKVECDSE
eukprot:6176430-Pleurochrysis_carterae.AAC.4